MEYLLILVPDRPIFVLHGGKETVGDGKAIFRINRICPCGERARYPRKVLFGAFHNKVSFAGQMELLDASVP